MTEKFKMKLILLFLLSAAISCGGNANKTDTCINCYEDNDVYIPETDQEEASDGFFPDIPYEDVLCISGAVKCGSIDMVMYCLNYYWIISQFCAEGYICLQGYCVKQESCTAGHINGCYSIDAQNICSDYGIAYVPAPCPANTKCVEDGVCKEIECVPKYSKCLDKQSYYTCLDDGSSYGEKQECPEGTYCLGGECITFCESEIKVASYMGCEYWTLDLHQWDEPSVAMSPPAEPLPQAVVISNPGTATTKIAFDTMAPGVTLNFSAAELTILAGETKVYLMPTNLSIKAGSSKTLNSIRIKSTHPITAHQFSPLNNEGVFSNDASLLLPVNALGTDYIAMSYGTVSPPAFMGPPMQNPIYGFFTIVAVSDGETEVSIMQLKAPTETGPGMEKLPKGGAKTFVLKKYEVLNIEGDADETGQDLTVNDLTGTIIKADKPIAVFGGHECANVLNGCCCDHLEEQLFPLHAWSNEYHGIKAKPRGSSTEVDVWRVLAGVDDIEISTNPPISGIDGLKLAHKGDGKEFKTNLSFEIKANGPISLGQYLVSQDSTADVIGDPSLILAVPIGQYRKDYAILTPAQYAQDWITIVRQKGIQVYLDNNPVTESFTSFGSGDYEYAYVKMKPGVHHLSSNSAFGLSAYGFDTAVSYGFPGGLNLIKLQKQEE
jgi:hypothetical protein